MLRGGKGRVPRGAAVVARKWVPMGREHVHGIFRSAAVGAFKRLPVELAHMHVGGKGRAPRGAEMVACKWLSVGQVDVRACGESWAPRGSAVDTRERLPMGRRDVLVCGSGRGQLEVLQWARANGCPWDYRVCEHATRGGHLEMLNWARVNGCPG